MIYSLTEVNKKYYRMGPAPVPAVTGEGVADEDEFIVARKFDPDEIVGAIRGALPKDIQHNIGVVPRDLDDTLETEIQVIWTVSDGGVLLGPGEPTTGKTTRVVVSAMPEYAATKTFVAEVLLMLPNNKG